MAPIAISSPNVTYDAIDHIKAALKQNSLNGSSDRSSKSASSSTPAPAFSFDRYSNFQSTPAIGIEFRAYSPDGKPVLSIRDVLGNDERLKALGRLV